MNLDAHIQQKTNLCRPWSDLKTCFVINHKNGILFIFESFHCCLYICHTLNPKKSSKYGFIHYWCCIPWIAWGGCAKNKMQHIFNTNFSAIQNDATLPKIKNKNYESRGYVRMLCTDELRMLSILIEVVSTPLYLSFERVVFSNATNVA